MATKIPAAATVPSGKADAQVEPSAGPALAGPAPVGAARAARSTPSSTAAHGAKPHTDPHSDIGPAALRKAAALLQRGSVLVIGDVMLDRYVYGTVGRISAEAPVPVLAVERETALPGGAGNVVRNLTALGAPVAFISVVGDDQAGSDLTALVGGQSGVEPWLLVQSGRATTTKTRFVASGQQLLRTDHEQIRPINSRLADRMVKIAGDAVAATSAVILSDYRKGVLASATVERVIAMAAKAGRPVAANPRGTDLAAYAGATLLVLEAQDLATATGLAVETPSQLEAAAVALRAECGARGVLVTRGDAGLTLVEEGRTSRLAASGAELRDPLGVVDTVLAVMGAALAAGVELVVAAHLANAAAGIVAGKSGTAVAADKELAAVLTPGPLAMRKVLSRAEAVEQVERWRRQGWRIGFAHGAFDLLDPEHLTLLEQARGWCDRLVVGLAGAVTPAPRQPASARAAVLAALTTVDLVTVYEEAGPYDLIQRLRPDLVVLADGEAAISLPGWKGTVRFAGDGKAATAPAGSMDAA